jgi:hypothetical protein
VYVGITWAKENISLFIGTERIKTIKYANLEFNFNTLYSHCGTLPLSDN